MNFADIAQSVERILGKDEVASSNLAISSKSLEICGFQGFLLYLPVKSERIPEQSILTKGCVLIYGEKKTFCGQYAGELKDFSRSLLNLYIIQSMREDKVNQFIAGIVRLCGEFIQRV